MAKSDKNQTEAKAPKAEKAEKKEASRKAAKSAVKAEKKAAKAAAPKREKKARAKAGAANVSHYQTIKSPVITEKSTTAGEFGKYTFKVCVHSSKTQVRDAVEALFGVEVTKVNVINYDGKVKAFRQRMGQRDAYKKAIVTLKQGQSIDLTSGLKG